MAKKTTTKPAATPAVAPEKEVVTAPKVVAEKPVAKAEKEVEKVVAEAKAEAVVAEAEAVEAKAEAAAIVAEVAAEEVAEEVKEAPAAKKAHVAEVATEAPEVTVWDENTHTKFEEWAKAGSYEIRFKGGVVYDSVKNNAVIAYAPAFVRIGHRRFAYTQIQFIRK